MKNYTSEHMTDKFFYRPAALSFGYSCPKVMVLEQPEDVCKQFEEQMWVYKSAKAALSQILLNPVSIEV